MKWCTICSRQAVCSAASASAPTPIPRRPRSPGNRRAHVGHEVIVSFLEGDPDRPMITGNVPNALTMPPMVLPRDKDKTIQRDHGDNKIVMQGKSGEEHLSMMS